MSPDTEDRSRWMSVLAQADGEDLAKQVRTLLPSLPRYAILRGPEMGLVMVRGRAGGEGPRFNLGEMTVTRCSVRLEQGTVGHAYIAGRDQRHAELAALLDALLQDEAEHRRLQTELIDPLAAKRAEQKRTVSAKSAATKVDFFTLVRGED